MKIIQRIAGAFLLIGLLVGGIVLVRTGGNFSQLGNENQVQKEKTFEVSQIKELSFEMIASDVKVTGSADTDQVLIKYPESKSRTYTIIEENGKLIISEKKEPILGIFTFDFFSSEAWTVQVILPVDNLDNVTLDSSSGDVEFQKLVIKENLDLSLSSSDVRLETVTVAGETSVQLSSGEIDLTNVVSKDLYLKATSGGLQVDGVIVANQTTMETTSGAIRFSQFKAGQETELSATSGDIRGDLLGKMTEYSIQSTVTSGANNLPQELDEGYKQLRVKTTSGDIDVQFEQ
ncbi:DUF4097 family beta strand repeat-containing protein [Streptococcus oriscaviae]|uniref:DUF4097 family beta strand repeat protein n=1 Tax=Streptococcus oriscaviae TaxID=2781599 RepID=A0ABX7YL13_9STRE|nr:DUF4097 family beta strand repeat-containing protein [Streptococcus oriscaviae]QUE54508.1 DUF4097 family beta strand repeat protein [Streptococcus oriscaviae]